MPRMWRGHNAELKAAEANPLWALLHRRNGKINISCNVDSQDNTAEFYRIEQGSGRCGTWFRYDLGEVKGVDPMFNCLWGSHRFTPADAELFSLHYQVILGRLDEITTELAALDKLDHALDEFLAIFE